ncbi:MOSC domain-containing protein [Jatrophihabitans sp.]|uniref:MOSC domain-containing protein n=1 Tax=Jatrophihabitans sp. TaxID=1932789 RepID=UPI0030C700CE|nr:domain containing protein [Jatrophihabitans sp.]
MSSPRVLAVSSDAEHRFSKVPADAITLLAGLGVAGDAHCGATVQHRSRVARDPTAPNLRQVHLITVELIEELVAAGFDVGPGVLGENLTTAGLDLLALPAGTVLALGAAARIEITGLRNPCVQLDRHQRGLTAAVLDRAEDGALIRRAGVMAVVLDGGEVRPGDQIVVTLPGGPHSALQPV